MFVPPAQITPTMAANVPSDLSSFDQFKKVNGTHVIPYFQIKKFAPGTGSIWGPDGPALRIILSRHERVVGGIMAVPAKYGWNPWYDQAAGHPVLDPFSATFTRRPCISCPGLSLNSCSGKRLPAAPRRTPLLHYQETCFWGTGASLCGGRNNRIATLRQPAGKVTTRSDGCTRASQTTRQKPFHACRPNTTTSTGEKAKTKISITMPISLPQE